jgi:hypothetical protein
MINGRVRWLSADRTQVVGFLDAAPGPRPEADGETTTVTRPPDAGIVQPALPGQTGGGNVRGS